MEKIGAIIRNKVKERGLTHVEFARLINTHIRNVYNIYNRVSLDTNLLQQISEVLKFDFFSILGSNSDFDNQKVSENHHNIYSTSSHIDDLLLKIKQLEEENTVLKDRVKDKNAIIRLMKKQKK